MAHNTSNHYVPVTVYAWILTEDGAERTIVHFKPGRSADAMPLVALTRPMIDRPSIQRALQEEASRRDGQIRLVACREFDTLQLILPR